MPGPLAGRLPPAEAVELGLERAELMRYRLGCVADFGSQAKRVRRIPRIVELARTEEGRDRLRRAWFWTQIGRYAEAITIRDRRGNRVILDTADPWLSRVMFLDGAHDPENVDSVVRELRARGIVPDQVIDAGANIGTSTLDYCPFSPTRRRSRSSRTRTTTGSCVRTYSRTGWRIASGR